MTDKDSPDVVTRVEGHASSDAPVVTEPFGPSHIDGQGRAPSLATQTARVAMSDWDTARAGNIALLLAALSALQVMNELWVYRSGSRTLRSVAIWLFGAVALSGVLIRAIRGTPARVRVPATLGFIVLLVATAVCESLHLGVFSAFQASVVLAMFVLGLDGRTRLIVSLGALACVAYLVPALLIAVGGMEDPGVFSSARATQSERVAAATGTIVVYVAALWGAGVVRRSIQTAVERSNEAVLRAQQREALLAEANRNLDAVLRADASRGGRYTGVTVDDFRLGGIIGRGGMGEVYAAERVTNGRPAAVKLLTQRAAGDVAMVTRFLREVDFARKLRVPHVVEVLAAGEGPGGEPYLAMELLLGHDLAWHLRQRPSLSLEETLLLVDQVAAGLQAANAAGIVHRDLKPQNLFLHQPAEVEGHAAGSGKLEPVWKILDFGIGKLQGSGGTLTGLAVVGTPGYMAPEQVRGGAIDARADVFALGAVVYRVLTGHPPFGGTEVQAMFDVAYRQPSAPTDLQRSLPKDVDRVLAVALAKEARERFATASELAVALRAASREDLAPAVRGRALAILRAWPWGSVRQHG